MLYIGIALPTVSMASPFGMHLSLGSHFINQSDLNPLETEDYSSSRLQREKFVLEIGSILFNKLNPNLTVFAGYDYEQTLSNQPLLGGSKKEKNLTEVYSSHLIQGQHAFGSGASFWFNKRIYFSVFAKFLMQQISGTHAIDSHIETSSGSITSKHTYEFTPALKLLWTSTNKSTFFIPFKKSINKIDPELSEKNIFIPSQGFFIYGISHEIDFHQLSLALQFQSEDKIHNDFWLDYSQKQYDFLFNTNLGSFALSAGIGLTKRKYWYNSLQHQCINQASFNSKSHCERNLAKWQIQGALHYFLTDYKSFGTFYNYAKIETFANERQTFIRNEFLLMFEFTFPEYKTAKVISDKNSSVLYEF